MIQIIYLKSHKLEYKEGRIVNTYEYIGINKLKIHIIV